MEWPGKAQEAGGRLAYRRVAILADALEQLPELSNAIHQFASGDMLLVFVWI